jgi:hypothetical protein
MHMRWDVNCSSTSRQLYLAYWKYDSFECSIWSLEEKNRRRTIFQIFWIFISLWDTYSISVFFPLAIWLAEPDCTRIRANLCLSVSAHSVMGDPLHSRDFAGDSRDLAGGFLFFLFWVSLLTAFWLHTNRRSSDFFLIEKNNALLQRRLLKGAPRAILPEIEEKSKSVQFHSIFHRMTSF